ncbi:hypothetical protein IJ818_07520 [bacterium]|nr:hypothetical protein [bacterium]
MQCPKCNHEVNADTKICPNCKKVLQLTCPVCGTLNKTGICTKCGFTILSKCHNCGKINLTQNENCSKCGMDTYLSIALNESSILDFACIVIEFPNMSRLKEIFNSQDAFKKFQSNLHNLIVGFCSQIGIKWQIIDKAYIIKFNKEQTFDDSVFKALSFIIEIAKPIMKLNIKLHQSHNTLLRCNFTLIKRNINTRPKDFKSGFNIKMMYKNTSQGQYHNALQVLLDSSTADVLRNKISLVQLGTVLVKDKLEIFFELDLKKYIPMPKESDEPKDSHIKERLKELSLDDIDTELELQGDDTIIHNIKKLNFDEQVCEFITVESGDLNHTVLSLLAKNPKNIISIKTNKKYYPISNEIPRIVLSNKLCERVIKVTCTDDTKNKPYGFFYELLSSIFKFSVSAKNFVNNNFATFETLDKTGVVKSLINLQPIKGLNPEDVRDTLYNIFTILFNSLEHCLIYVENFEKVDITSFEILQLLLKDFDKYNLNLLLLADENFSLHKNSHFLLSNPVYTEIILKGSNFEKIITPLVDLYSNILDSFYLEKIAQYTKGCPLYLRHATYYLLENDILEVKNNKYAIKNQTSVVFSPTIEKLLETRFRFLTHNKSAYSVFVLLLYLGPRIDIATLQSLNIPDLGNVLGILDESGYIYLEDNIVYFNNYNLLKSIIDNMLDENEKQKVASFLLNTVVDEKVPLPVNLNVYTILNDKKKIQDVWKKLSNIVLLLGDFSSYLNYSITLLKLMEEDSDEETQKSINEYKMIIYENISNMLYKFIPTKLYNFSKLVLENIEHAMEDKKVINLCNKILQCCLRTGNYTQATTLSNKILSRLPESTFNPADKNFNKILFWVSLIKVNIFFNTGYLKECVSLGEDLISMFTPENIALLITDKMPQDQVFSSIFDTVGYVCIAKIFQSEDVRPLIKRVADQLEVLPESYSLFIYLQRFMRGEDYDLNINPQMLIDSNIFGTYIYNILKAFEFINSDIRMFAKNVYQAKLSAKENNLAQLDLICDLLIGYSYKVLGEYDKSNKIYQNVKEIGNQNGLLNASILAWYFIGDLKIVQNHPDIGLGIAKNTMALLDKNPDSNELLSIMFNLLISRIYTQMGENEKAESYKNQAQLLIDKNELNNNYFFKPKMKESES